MKELLATLCRYPHDPAGNDRLRELLGTISDWQKTAELINSHGIIALAAYNITAAGLDASVPAEFMTMLNRGMIRSISRNAWLTERWKEVNGLLSAAGIKHILLKGMALEYTLYEGRGLRQMSDNDILVRKDDAFRAYKILIENGFGSELIKSPLHRKILPDIGKHMPALSKDGYSVEIHVRLFNDGEAASPGLFETAEEILVAGEKALVLSKENHLAYLVSHFRKHALEGNCQVRQYADIMLLDSATDLQFPDEFVETPFRGMDRNYRRAAYREDFFATPRNLRFRYLLGDIFPSLTWMRNRYKCSTAMALLRYPFRIAKAFWLLG